MSTIWLDEHCRMTGYGASTKGAKSKVTITIECADGHSLGYLLDSLRRIDDAQRAAGKAEKKPARAKVDAPKRLETTERLALPYYGSRS